MIDEVLRANEEKETSTSRKEPISLKKLEQGDCTWAFLKLVLSWMIDTIKETLKLPAKRNPKPNPAITEKDISKEMA